VFGGAVFGSGYSEWFMSFVEYAVRLTAGQLDPAAALTLSPPEKEQVLVLSCSCCSDLTVTRGNPE